MNIQLENTTTIYTVEMETVMVTVSVDENHETNFTDVICHIDGDVMDEMEVIDDVLVKDIKEKVVAYHFYLHD